MVLRMVAKLEACGDSGVERSINRAVDTASVAKKRSRGGCVGVRGVIVQKYGDKLLQSVARRIVKGKGNQPSRSVNPAYIDVFDAPDFVFLCGRWAIIETGMKDFLLLEGFFGGKTVAKTEKNFFVLCCKKMW